jgi:hypothetical protein
MSLPLDRRSPAILFRGKVFTGSRHVNALDAAVEHFSGGSEESAFAIRDSIDDGENFTIGYVNEAGVFGTVKVDEGYLAAQKKIARRGFL